MAQSRSILVVGEHNVGKTNYGIQLFGRLRLAASRLEMAGTPASIAPFEAGLASLNDGRAPDHTPTAANHELILPLRLDQRTFSLSWPDYGGEQVSDILRTRALSEVWQRKVDLSDAWMLFIRLSADTNTADALKRPATGKRGGAKAPPPVPETTQHVNWNSNARTIELLQMLLHAKRVNTRGRVHTPPLLVALACWDELNEEARPGAALAARMPLLHAYLTNAWAADDLAIFGLSSLGGNLDTSEVKDTHRDEGPEQQGYVVLPNGDTTIDIAEPVVWLLERLQ